MFRRYASSSCAFSSWWLRVRSSRSLPVAMALCPHPARLAEFDRSGERNFQVRTVGFERAAPHHGICSRKILVIDGKSFGKVEALKNDFAHVFWYPLLCVCHPSLPCQAWSSSAAARLWRNLRPDGQGTAYPFRPRVTAYFLAASSFRSLRSPSAMALIGK